MPGEGGGARIQVFEVQNSPYEVHLADSKISSARRGVRLGPTSSWEQGELDLLPGEPLSLISTSLVVADNDRAKVLASCKICA
ncbi:hypothetical protein NDU88_002230 [Pleurodeles waltl]|uniref:Uncharacterized protein n=1 Tax=Pleurodeles waltl TaxID=8319 RepID=A0AAV7UCK0_PLEWA|nr:hypothetical protein NDU88_002230 [Pleurodeles waltl]